MGCLILNLTGCSNGELDQKQHIITLSDRQAKQKANDIEDQVTLKLADDSLDVSLWASDTLLEDPVGLDMDNQGRAWVSVTNRSTSDEFDIRGHRDWMIRSIAFKTVEDRLNFLHEELSPENSDKNKWLDDRNGDGSHDWRDLTIQKEEIVKIEDTSGDGIANRSQRYIKAFHKEDTDVLGAVLYDDYNGDVYAGVAPDMWRLKDTDDDGLADRKNSISHGYQVHIGFSGHGMSGLEMGPDGRLYWGIGDLGINITGPDGKKWVYPNQGVVVRSEPDGSNFEVYAHGVRNTHEITFDKFGNLISVDNDGDHRGEYERVVYLVNGSDSGWRATWQYGKYVDPKNNDYNVWMQENYFHPRFAKQAAHLLPPVAPYHPGPAGLAYNPGTALSSKWKDHFFSVEYTGSTASSGINAFTLKPNGAGFDLASDQMFMKGIQATGLDVGPDGALYFADWIEGWDTKDRGRVWRLDTPATAHNDIRTDTQKLLGADFSSRSAGDLQQLLAHPDMRVRKKAQFALARRGDAETLRAAVRQTDQPMERIHGIWGLWQLARKDIGQAGQLMPYLTDPDPEVRAQVAKVLGDVRYKPAAEKLIPLLKDESNRVTFFATQALGRIGYHEAIQPIVAMVAAHQDKDVYLRHGSAVALARIGDAEALRTLADHPSRAVRIVAVVALRRLNDPGVGHFLDDDDEYIVTNAARAINDDAQIKEEIPKLASMLDERTFTNEPLVRREINANLYSGTPDDARRLARFAASKDASDEMRVEAIRTLGVWPHPSTLDRVTGRYRGEPHHDTTAARQALAGVMEHLLNQPAPEVRAAAAKSASQLRYTSAAQPLFTLVKSDSSPEVRIAALHALQDMGYGQLEQVVETALHDQAKQVRMEVIGMIPDMNLPASQVVQSLGYVLQNGSVIEQQSALKTLGQMQNKAANQILDKQMDQLMAGTLPAEIQLDLLNAVAATGDADLQAKVQKYQQSKPEGDIIAQYREALKGGDADAGRRIFYRDQNAQCVRCHALGDNGGNVGPDLSHIGGKLTRKQLLQALVDPSGRIAPGFGNVTVRLENGQKVQGTLSEETDSYLVLETGEGHQQKVQKSNIAKRTNATSAMPPMESILSKDDIRNVVQFLNDRK